MDMSLFYLNNVNGPVKRKKNREREGERVCFGDGRSALS
jgi:hypothetical protein